MRMLLQTGPELVKENIPNYPGRILSLGHTGDHRRVDRDLGHSKEESSGEVGGSRCDMVLEDGP